MPVPGSLRKMPVDEDQIAELLSRQFNLPREETQAYLKLLDTSYLTIEQLAKELNLTGEGTKGLVASMIERGLIIEASGPVAPGPESNCRPSGQSPDTNLRGTETEQHKNERLAGLFRLLLGQRIGTVAFLVLTILKNVREGFTIVFLLLLSFCCLGVDCFHRTLLLRRGFLG